MAQRVSPPCYQHGPLDHGEVVSDTDESVLLEGSGDAGEAPEKIEAGLQPEKERVKRIAPEKTARRQADQQQERCTKSQEFVASELKGKSPVPERVYQVEVGHEDSDATEKRSDPSARFGLSRSERHKPAPRCRVHDRAVASARRVESPEEIARQCRGPIGAECPADRKTGSAQPDERVEMALEAAHPHLVSHVESLGRWVAESIDDEILGTDCADGRISEVLR